MLGHAAGDADFSASEGNCSGGGEEGSKVLPRGPAAPSLQQTPALQGLDDRRERTQACPTRELGVCPYRLFLEDTARSACRATPFPPAPSPVRGVCGARRPRRDPPKSQRE